MTRLALITIALLVAFSEPGFDSPIREDNVQIGQEPDTTPTVYSLEAAERAVNDSVMMPLEDRTQSGEGFSRRRSPRAADPRPSTSGVTRSRTEDSSETQDIWLSNTALQQGSGRSGSHLPNSQASGASINEILRGLVNISHHPGSPQPTMNGQASGGSSGRGSAQVSLADQFLAEVLESALVPSLEDDGTITFSVLGFGQFQVEFHGDETDPIIHVVEHESGLSFTRDPTNDVDEMVPLEQAGPVQHRLDRRISVRQILREIVMSVLYSPIFYLFLVGGAVIYFHRWLRRA